MDWDQMQKHKDRWKPATQGNQVLLDPKGNYLAGTKPGGERYALPDLIRHLDRALQLHPPKPERKNDLRLSWFLWNPKKQGYPGSFGAESVCKLDRKPLLTLSGSIPDWLQSPVFLRKHLRQFIWTQAAEDGPPRLTVRQLKPEAKELASLDLSALTPEEASRLLDRAWLEYMKVRPFVARGYIDNPHGRWLKQTMEAVHQEELRVREAALKGTLKSPGR